MKKNIFAFISLGLSLLALILCVVAFIPREPIVGSSFKLYNSTSTAIAGTSLAIAAAAFVASIVAMIMKKKRGPRKTALILSIVLLLIALLTSAVVGIFKVVTDYANGKPSIYDDMNDEDKKKIDDLINAIKKEYPADSQQSE